MRIHVSLLGVRVQYSGVSLRRPFLVRWRFMCLSLLGVNAHLRASTADVLSSRRCDTSVSTVSLLVEALPSCYPKCRLQCKCCLR